ncbi:hypothetical protein EAG_04771 [Camponotus floridanus]|uniref:Fuseless n=1 Tax=Camponotus floridanus TaxID=104421 RepID=E2AI68_CAMFO|nr:uncharacterized protein LOC112637032 [Camponotus floridanus]EFN66867.1 hypothetical protein EAG_04771 [Camponotus floridanus]
MTSGATIKFDPDWVRMVELRAASAGMTGGLDRRSSNRLHYAILTILDTIFSALMIAPAVVGYWRGTWELSDFYVYPNEPVLSTFASIAIGFTGLFVFNVLQHSLVDILHPDKHRLSYYLGSRLYTSVFGLCCVNAWRGIFNALDIYTEQTPGTIVATTAVSLLALGIMRAIRNLSAPPFALVLDSCSGYFEVQTMFRVNNTRDWSLYLLDCAFSVGVVGTLIVFVWRGVWILIDIYLFPENPKCSAVGSLAIGYFLVAVTFCLQPLMRYVCARLQGLVLLIVADAFLLLSFLGTVNVWRGIWNALDLWLLPDNPELSCWITHIGSFVFLVLLNCSNTILVRGVYIDAEEEAGKCVVFPCHYLRLFFKIEREKKQARQQNLLASQHFDGRTNVNEKDSENGTLLPNNTIKPANADSLG